MDHETAVQLQAAERYVLEEFSPKERADFEEHFFGCPGCADEVRSATILAANTTATNGGNAPTVALNLDATSKDGNYTLVTSASTKLFNTTK